MSDQYIIIGKLGSTVGLKGWIRIFPVNSDNADFECYTPLYIKEAAQWSELAVEQVRRSHQKWLIKFPAINDCDTARKLVGRELAIERMQLNPLPNGEYYWIDLIGCTVLDQQGVILGRVVYLLATGANDVLVIQDHGGREHALPYLLEQVIKEIDLVARKIKVCWELI